MTHAPTITRLAIALIRRDGGTQIRAQISMDMAREYADAMAHGAIFPPIEVRYDGTDHWVTDGYHRLMGADLLAAETIDAIVRPGTRRDAILDAVGANALHGIRRTNADKRQAVLTLLGDPEWSTKSDREIARLCHVGADMVGGLRPPSSVAERQQPAKREVTRRGKTFEMDVTAINRERAPAPEPVPEPEPEPASEPAPAPVPTRGSVQLRTLLGQLRAGADVRTAAVVAEIAVGEARAHALAEARGEYADIVAIEPKWKIDDDHLILALSPGGEEVSLAFEPEPEARPEAAADNDDAPPPAFDFEGAQIRDAAVQAILALAKAPTPEAMAELWAAYTGRGVPIELVVRARAWLDEFADLFPAAEAARQAAITLKMETM